MKKWNRRKFLQGLACATGAAAYASMPGGLLLPKKASAAFFANRRLLLIQADGGWDSQFFFLPDRNDTANNAFYTARPSAGPLWNNGLPLNGTNARVPTGYTSFQTLWNAGEVAAASVARMNQTKSHQVARETNSLFQGRGWAANLAETANLTDAFNIYNNSSILPTNGASQITGSLSQFGFSKSTSDAQMARATATALASQTGLTGSQATDYENGLSQAANLESQIALTQSVTPAVQSYSGNFGNQLFGCEKLVATFPNIIKIMETRRGGMDNHSSVVTSQANNIREIFDQLLVFRTNMIARGEWNNITVLTISEFGRTWFENGNAGTDHGYGNVQFMIGSNVNGGVKNACWDKNSSSNNLAAPNDIVEYYAPLVNWLAPGTDLSTVFKGANLGTAMTGIIS